jgi:hypothetical protein
LADPTHTERKTCELRVRELADYMAASQQRRRTVLRDAKYRPVARTLQHKEARTIISNWLRDGHGDTSTLGRHAERMRARHATSDFVSSQNNFSADYIETFMNAFPLMDIPACEMRAPSTKGQMTLGGTKIIFNPDILVARSTTRNTRRIGSVFLRYAKGKELSEEAALFQSSFSFGYLRLIPFEEPAEVEKKLCMTIDGYTGKVNEAPGNAVYRFNEMTAACSDITALWPNIQPPPSAIL